MLFYITCIQILCRILTTAFFQTGYIVKISIFTVSGHQFHPDLRILTAVQNCKNLVFIQFSVFICKAMNVFFFWNIYRNGNIQCFVVCIATCVNDQVGFAAFLAKYFVTLVCFQYSYFVRIWFYSDLITCQFPIQIFAFIYLQTEACFFNSLWCFPNGKFFGKRTFIFATTCYGYRSCSCINIVVIFYSPVLRNTHHAVILHFDHKGW